MSDPLTTDAPDPIPEIAPEIAPDPVPSPAKKSGLDEKRLAQLASARKRAAVVHKEKAQQRLRDKVAAMGAPIKPPQSEVVTPPPHHEQPIVIVEQSESDEETLEGPPGVVFVRRRRPKPKVPEKSADELRMDALYSRMFEY